MVSIRASLSMGLALVPVALCLLSSVAVAKKQCPAGSFLSVKNTCEFCPAGTYSTNSSQGKCQKCPPGSVTFSWNSKSIKDCKTCPLGSYADDLLPPQLISCRECYPTDFGDKPGSCRPCPRGTSNAAFGSTRCRVCPPGTRAVRGIAVMDIGACEKCPAGTYNPRWRSATCMQCPRGSKPNRFRTACIATCGRQKNTRLCQRTCAPGSARSRPPSPCMRCPPRKVGYANSVTQCASCPETFVPNWKRTGCVCPAGKGAHNGRCVQCPAATTLRNGICMCLPPSMKTRDGCKCPAFKMARKNKCVPCSRFQLLTEIKGDFRSDCVLCPANKQFEPKTGTCVQCPSGTVLPRGERGPCRKAQNVAA